MIEPNCTTIGNNNANNGIISRIVGE